MQDPPLSFPEQPAAIATNGLAIDLFHALDGAQPGGNLFFSPYSLAVALTMAAEGARDQTADEMARVLHFPASAVAAERPVTAVHGAFATLAQRFRAGGGDASAAVQRRIEMLRGQLDEANRQAEGLQRERKWEAAEQATVRAQQVADELNGLLKNVSCYDLRVANAIWVEQTFPLLPSYVQTIGRFHGTGGANNLDIVGNADAARLRINGWVEDHTNQRIKDLIPPGALSPADRLVITNAVYFLGEWATPFDAGATRDRDFALASGKRIQATLMHDAYRQSVPYAAFASDGSVFQTPTKVPEDVAKRPPTYPGDGGFTMIELPYKGDELAMLLLLPRTPDGLHQLEQMLTGPALASWVGQLQRRTVDTAMLRFKQAASHELGKTLAGLGMRRAFQNPAAPGGAQFGGMSASADPARQLFLGGVFHRAWIEVTEKGTEAAAATVTLMPSGAAPPPVRMVPFTPVFHTDHPFLFLIRDTRSGAILFLGRMLDPRA
jgi:serine protease inhibitor